MTDSKSDDGFSDDCFRDYLRVTHRLTGITIGANRKALVRGRFRRRIRDLGLPGYSEYLDYLRSHPEETATFVDLVTTNETHFFRTPRIWEYVEKEFLPSWHREHPGGTLRAWSAAASSGEEAGSLGILCQEFRLRTPGFSFEVHGTDISEEQVGLCREGRYTGRSIEAFQSNRPDLFRKYMRPEGEAFTLVPSVRERLRFQTHNLFERVRDPKPFDLVLLRNVLIYFVPTDQAKVLEQVHRALVPGGTLIIGESESLGSLKTDFDPLVPLIYRAGGKKAA
ncbi:MAG: protein-glutamate O-methyltransferase CheR [Bdellovibrionales bacterium]|nr:protein-glutamate O-methyltransferase CheR [Bdellovibrionales bacterium]